MFDVAGEQNDKGINQKKNLYSSVLSYDVSWVHTSQQVKSFTANNSTNDSLLNFSFSLLSVLIGPFKTKA